MELKEQVSNDQFNTSVVIVVVAVVAFLNEFLPFFRVL